jgi:hypothetical protein
MIQEFTVYDVETTDAAKHSSRNRENSHISILRRKKIHIKIWDIFLSCLTRTVFLLESAYVIYYLCTFSKNNNFCFLVIGMVVIAVDGAYIVIKRHGREHSWFSLSSFTYTGIMLTSIWFLAFEKFFSLENKCNEDAESSVEMHDYFWNAVILFEGF